MPRLTPVVIVCLWVFCYALTPPPILAQLTINELLPNPSGDEKTEEWIELYNNSDQPIDITGYQLRDSVESHLFAITSDHFINSSTISPHSHLLIYPKSTNKFSLNNSGQEDIYLYNDSTTSAQLLDSVSYNGSSEDQSWGRIPNGVGELTANITPTPGEANQPPSTPTPTATPTPKPTSTPKSTTTPQTSSTPVPTITITHTTSTTLQKSPSPHPTSLVTDSETNVSTSSSPVLGLSTTSAFLQSSPSPSDPNPTDTLDPRLTGRSRYFLFFIASGICLTLAVFFPIIKHHLLTRIPFLKLA